MLETTDIRLVGTMLVGGFAVFLTGAIFWRFDYEGPLPQALAAIAASPRRWRWIHVWMIAGIAVTVLGLGGLTHLFIGAGGSVYSSFALLLFAMGALIWLVGAVWHLTVLLGAALESQEQGSERELSDIRAWGDWFGGLHTVHLVSAYLSWIFLAASLLDTGILTDWIGWLGIAMGSTFAAGYVAFKGGPFSPPILAHLYTLVVGIALLVKAA